jgi:hypothetical protein
MWKQIKVVKVYTKNNHLKKHSFRKIYLKLIRAVRVCGIRVITSPFFSLPRSTPLSYILNGCSQENIETIPGMVGGRDKGE